MFRVAYDKSFSNRFPLIASACSPPKRGNSQELPPKGGYCASTSATNAGHIEEFEYENSVLVWGGFFVVVADGGVGCGRFEFAFPCRPLPPGALALPRKPLPTDI